MVLPIIILHGWGADASRFAGLKTRIKSQGWPVCIPDIPGFGKEPPPETAWHVNDYVQWLETKRDELGWEQICLVGHSFGGQIALKYTVVYPERVSRLILIAPAAVRQKRRLWKWIIKWFVEAGKLIFSLPGINVFYDWSRWLVYRLLGSVDYYRSTGVMREIIKNILDEDLQGIMAEVACPVLLLWGETDQLIPIQESEIYRAKIPDIAFESHPQGHNFAYYDDEYVFNAMKEFIT